MADFNPIFEVDASKILAKLHLAGQSLTKNAVVVNTAIKNPDKSATPNNPGKVEFNLENKSGEYQLAIIRPLEYLVPIDPTKNKKYVKAKEELDKFMKDHEKDLPAQDEKKDEKDAGNKTEDKKDDAKEKEQEKKNKNTSLTDKNALKKTEIKDSLEVKSFLEYLTEADKDKKPDEKILEQLEDLQKPLLELYKEYDLEKYEEVQDKESDKVDYNASAKSFEEALTEENKQRLADKEKLTTECKKAALNDLKNYFINFAGKDNQAKIKDADIVVKNASAEGHSEDPKDFEDKIKEFKLEVEEVDEQIKKNQEKLQDDPIKVSKEVYAHDVALVVGYKIDID